MPRYERNHEILLSDFGPYEPVPSLHQLESEHGLLGAGRVSEWDHIQNLDVFFIRIYKHYQEKGLWCIVTSRILNILTLGFTIIFSGFLLLYVDWDAVWRGCPVEDDCDFVQLAVYSRPLHNGSNFKNTLVIVYLIIFSIYWVWTVLRFLLESRPLLDIHRFCCIKLGLTLREIQTMGWSELVNRIVLAQSSMRLCVVKELTALDIVSRIMRKENYLIGMLNKDVLCLQLPLPGVGRRVMLTKILEWNLYWCILDCMFDNNFLIRREFTLDERGLKQRLRFMAICNIIVSPFLMVFMLIYFFLRNAESIYHHPSSIGTRNWSALAEWKLREFNELPHIMNERLNQSYVPAARYVSQFPSPAVSMGAKFVAFIVGAFAAGIIGLALVDERLLEAHIHGRKLVWYAAIFATILAVCRALITEEHKVFAPEVAMKEVVKHTHYFPRKWRNRCHHMDVQSDFEQLYQYKVVIFLEEMLSIFSTPIILWFSLPNSARAILDFVRDFSVRVEGVGDVCSLSMFDFENHGNSFYGAPVNCSKQLRSNQGKMEKSFLSFHALYNEWEPNTAGQQMLSNLQNFRESQITSQTAPSHIDVQATQSLAMTRPAYDNPLASSGLILEDFEREMEESQATLQHFYLEHVEDSPPTTPRNDPTLPSGRTEFGSPFHPDVRDEERSLHDRSHVSIPSHEYSSEDEGRPLDEHQPKSAKRRLSLSKSDSGSRS
mmetsp:Transcript_9788/g.16809  ORF Transcript_9788/g.16809 Transcript_9788/m.16809 type:complete len:717 (+) Transcript_9788:381-2531(+)